MRRLGVDTEALLSASRQISRFVQSDGVEPVLEALRRTEALLSENGFGGQDFQGLARRLSRRLTVVGENYMRTAKDLIAMAEIYKTCEDRLIRALAGAGGAIRPKPAAPKPRMPSGVRDLLDALGVARTRKDTRSGKERERAAEQLLADSVTEIFQQGNVINKQQWQKASLSERTAMLEGLVGELNEVFGTDVRFTTFYEKPEDGMVTNGYYNDNSRRISINEYSMQDQRYEDVMTTVVHEMRHAYQHQVIRQPERYEVTPDNVQAWKDNFDHYNAAEDGYSTYRNQPVEADARAFSENRVEYGSRRTQR